ncbi:MAG TPA: AzlC family ABC transporter permease [Xanthobacteraceae bacterium]|nr:AzlC family ABC transporter permease [Xanthobacteraceae bacterium]
MSVPPSASPLQRSPIAAFLDGFCAAWCSALAYVVLATYVGVAALGHDFGFSLWWVLASTLLLWVAPGQVILISALAVGATSVETAVAVGLSSARLLPMVVSLLPLIKDKDTPNRALILPMHLTSVSTWIEAQRFLPGLPRAIRVPFANGLGVGFMTSANIGTVVGFYLAGSLPPLLTAGLLFLTPMSFLISTTRNCRLLADWLALGIGIVLGPLLAWRQVGLDLLWTGIVGGSVAYGIHRLREALK